MTVDSYHRFQYLNDRELKVLTDHLKEVIEQWRMQWLPGAITVTTAVKNLDGKCRDEQNQESGEAVWFVDGDACALLPRPLGFAAVLLGQRDAAYLGDDKVVETLLAQAIKALMKLFLREVGAVVTVEKKRLSRGYFGGGCVDIEINAAGARLKLFVPVDRLTVPLAQPVPGVSSELPGRREEAIDSARICLSAVLGEIDLTIGELSSLERGNVVSFGLPTSTTFSLVNEQGIKICRGVLGEFGGCRALSIVDSAK